MVDEAAYAGREAAPAAAGTRSSGDAMGPVPAVVAASAATDASAAASCAAGVTTGWVEHACASKGTPPSCAGTHIYFLPGPYNNFLTGQGGAAESRSLIFVRRNEFSHQQALDMTQRIEACA